jgi:long-chain acyl-CoA synthetase
MQGLRVVDTDKGGTSGQRRLISPFRNIRDKFLDDTLEESELHLTTSKEERILNIAKLADDRVTEQGERVVLIFEDREITNLEMMIQAKKLAGALSALGVQRGDRVIIQMPNCPEVLQAFGAVYRLGAVIVPINYLVGDDEIAYIYQDSGAKVLISSLDFLPKIRAAQVNAPEMKTIILIDSEVPEGTLSLSRLLEESEAREELEETSDDEIAVLVYTSGTTGRPKGVIHTHYSLYANAKMGYETIPLPDGLTSLSVLPLCHSFGIANMNSGLFRVGKTVLLNSFDLETIFRSIEKYQVNFMAGVPTMYVYMLLFPEPHKYDLRSMKYWVSGSAPLALEVWKKFKEVFGGEIIEGWGLTEAGANNSVNPLDGLKKVGSIGLPMMGMEMKIMDDNDRILVPGDQGEIVIRGPQIMKGYWNKPEETAEILRDGWLHTGDVGHVDQDGYFWITDRKKDLIIKGGENISPRAVEESLFCHPKVSEAAVIGMKDEVYGENIRAFVVLNPGEAATEEEMMDYCREKLAKFFVPRTITIVPSLPKSLVGKILKKELRKWE